MSGRILDTHAVVWHLLASPELSQAALAKIEAATREGEPLCISAITVLEIVYLVEKKRLPETALERLVEAILDPESDLVCAPFEMATALAAQRVRRDDVPDMPDRVIAATALHLGVPLVTRDSRIAASGIQTVR
jgi:PIN domain nuclease of toxin-antitoxin system